jgi:hypothetical protein
MVEGFEQKSDKIDLTAFAGLTFKSLNFSGGGVASAYYDGRFLRVDADGDALTDLMVEFTNLAKLKADNFILA